MTSSFGRGLTYCLGLFLAHAAEYKLNKILFKTDTKSTNSRMIYILPKRWFRLASNHLFDLEIPNTLPQTLKKRLKAFKNTCLVFGDSTLNYSIVREQDVKDMLDEAKDLLREIDTAFKIKTEKAQSE